jgi:PTS system mannose-specific IIA component
MIGLVLVSHGALGQVLLKTATEIVGPIEIAAALTIERHQACEEIQSRLVETVVQMDQGEGVLILADMFGGTACNISLRIVESHSVEVVTGMNLPMLLKFSTERKQNSDLTALSQLLKYYGQRNIMVAGDVLKEREL